MRFEHDSAKAHPLEVTLKAGKHKWCSCGKTENPPWCDGTCKGGKPVKFKLDEKAAVEICNCGRTKKPPYCDHSQKECRKK